jgi:hypothetical protein
LQGRRDSEGIRRDGEKSAAGAAGNIKPHTHRDEDERGVEGCCVHDKEEKLRLPPTEQLKGYAKLLWLLIFTVAPCIFGWGDIFLF